ncbi:MAG: hypothetical protein HFG52_14545 [Lachnospiraceae bacterium]|nr:hypothetical protein [Lachnospiraceae bacterium]
MTEEQKRKVSDLRRAGMGYTETARLAGVSRDGGECRVKWWHEHPEKIKQRAVYSFTCAGCGKPFTAYGNSRRKYCSHECYIRNRFKGGDAGE